MQTITKRLTPGEVAPRFSLPNEDGVELALQDLDSLTIVLYFYPRDNTSGCTLEAKEFSELRADFDALGVMVLGVSPDSMATHKKFIQKQNLDLTLLSDPEKRVASLYGAYGRKVMYGKEVEGIIRSTFVIRGGEILGSFYNVKAKGHAKKILEFIKKQLAFED